MVLKELGEIKIGSKVRIKKPELSHKKWEVMALGMNLPEGCACIRYGANIQVVSIDHLELA
jgi:hypothetical protein